MEAEAEKAGSTAPAATEEGERQNGVEGGEEKAVKDDERFVGDLVSKSEVETAGARDACLLSDNGKSAYPLVSRQLPIDLAHVILAPPLPQSLVWSLGFNPSLPVHNVSEGSRKVGIKGGPLLHWGTFKGSFGLLYRCCSMRVGTRVCCMTEKPTSNASFKDT